MTLDEELVDLSDGVFEVLLIKYPSNPIELNSVLVSLRLGRFKENSLIEFFDAKRIEIECDSEMNWTLDGEFQKGSELIKIKNINEGITVLIPDGRKI